MRGRLAAGARVLVAAVLLCAACDLIENRKFDPPSAPPYGYVSNGPGGANGGKPSGGLGGYAVRDGLGGSSGFGGLGGTSGDVCGKDPTNGCILSCLYEVNMVSSAACNPMTGFWTCPPGLTARASCPPGTCAATLDYCCDHATGSLTVRPCNGGFRATCPAQTEYTATGARCVPDQLGGISDCSIISGMPCTTLNLECESSPTHCICQSAGSALYWACSILIPASPIP